MGSSDIDAEERASIESYANDVISRYGKDFADADKRVIGFGEMLRRFRSAVESVLAKGREHISGVDDTHNELCIASQLLANSDPQFVLVEYEPEHANCAKSIDFRARTDEGLVFYVDVKTIRPDSTDRWDQFEKALKEGWFPENVQISLSRDWSGGGIWHDMFAARARMLEHTMCFEAKIRNCDLLGDNNHFILALCGEGFHWHEDELEDFVSFYRSGHHRADDPFSKVDTKFIEGEGIILDRTISRFACMNRRLFDIRPRRLNWNVQPPKLPVF